MSCWNPTSLPSASMQPTTIISQQDQVPYTSYNNNSYSKQMPFAKDMNDQKNMFPLNSRTNLTSQNPTATTIDHIEAMSDSNGNYRNSSQAFQTLVSQLSEASKSITNIVRDLKEYKDQHINSNRSSTMMSQKSSDLATSFEIAQGQLPQNLNQKPIIPPLNQRISSIKDYKNSQISSIPQSNQDYSRLSQQINHMSESQYPPHTYVLQSPDDYQFHGYSDRIHSATSIVLPPSPNNIYSQTQQLGHFQREQIPMSQSIAVNIQQTNNQSQSQEKEDITENIPRVLSAQKRPRDKNSNMTKSFFNGSQTIIVHPFMHVGYEEQLEQVKKENQHAEMRRSAVLSQRVRSYTTYNEEKLQQQKLQQSSPLVMAKFEFQRK